MAIVARSLLADLIASMASPAPSPLSLKLDLLVLTAIDAIVNYSRDIWVFGAMSLTLLSVQAFAQEAKGAKSVRQAYGARLTPIGPDEKPKNGTRLVTRVDTRLNSRISTRIERFSITEDPTASLKTGADDTLKRSAVGAPAPQQTQEQNPD